MAVEEQTDVSRLWSSINATNHWGQKLTITNRTVSKLAFSLTRIGSPTGDLIYYIRKVSNGDIIVSKTWGPANTVPTSQSWVEVTFDTPTLIDEEVYILVGGTLSSGAGNLVVVYDANGADVKADEFLVRRLSGAYTDFTGLDFGYKYTYDVDVDVVPTVTTQAASNIGETTATANGNITDLGTPNPTAHGFAYSPTDPTPDIETDSVTDEGAASSTGAFTSDLT